MKNIFIVLIVATSACLVPGIAEETVSFTFGEKTYTLDVKEEHGREGYDDRNWPTWDSIPETKFIVRDQVLIDESLDPVTINEAGTNRTRVLTGRWICPYTGVEYTDADDVDVDHVVARAEAYDSGGWAWSNERKREFSNYLLDPDHLIAVHDYENQTVKNDRDPVGYLPRDEYVIEYLEDWVRIKAQWELSVDRDEVMAIQRALRCHLPR